MESRWNIKVCTRPPRLAGLDIAKSRVCLALEGPFKNCILWEVSVFANKRCSCSQSWVQCGT